MVCLTSNDVALWITIKLTLWSPFWAVISEQIKIESKFFLLGTWYLSLVWFETQSTVNKRVFVDFTIHLLHIFQKLVNSKIVWVVAMIFRKPVKDHEAICVTYSAYSLCTLWILTKSMHWNFWSQSLWFLTRKCFKNFRA